MCFLSYKTRRPFVFAWLALACCAATAQAGAIFTFASSTEQHPALADVKSPVTPQRIELRDESVVRQTLAANSQVAEFGVISPCEPFFGLGPPVYAVAVYIRRSGEAHPLLILRPA